MTVVDSSGVLAILLREADGRAVFQAIESSELLLAPALLPCEVLALRHRCRLVSLDASLRKAARAERLDVLPKTVPE